MTNVDQVYKKIYACCPEGIKLFQLPDPCKGNGGCVNGRCNVVNGAAKCSCTNINWKLLDDKKTCIKSCVQKNKKFGGVKGTQMKTVRKVANWQACRDLCRAEGNGCVEFNYFKARLAFKKKCQLLAVRHGNTHHNSKVVSGHKSAEGYCKAVKDNGMPIEEAQMEQPGNKIKEEDTKTANADLPTNVKKDSEAEDRNDSKLEKAIEDDLNDVKDKNSSKDATHIHPGAYNNLFKDEG